MRYVMLSDPTRNREAAIHIDDKTTGSITRCGRYFQEHDLFFPASIDDPYDRKCHRCFRHQDVHPGLTCEEAEERD